MTRPRLPRMVIYAILVSSAPSLAGTSRLSWQGWTVTITPADGPHVAVIDLWNAVTRGETLSEGMVTVGGVSCIVTVTHQPGRTPDSAVIDCGPDHIAVPAIIDIGEEQSAQALVYPSEAVGM